MTEIFAFDLELWNGDFRVIYTMVATFELWMKFAYNRCLIFWAHNIFINMSIFEMALRLGPFATMFAILFIPLRVCT